MKKNLFSIVLFTLILTCVMSFASCKKNEPVEVPPPVEDTGVCEHVYGEWNDAVEATCAADGAIAHYKCTKCGKYFNQNDMEIADIKIERTDHEYDHPFDLFCNLCNARKDPSLEIADIQLVGDGEFVIITYADGSTSIPDDFANCAHGDDYLFLTLEEHTATADGRYIFRCNVCQLFKLKTESPHDTAGTPIVVDPTCILPGSTTPTCSVCHKVTGSAEEIPALGHIPNAEEARIILDPGKNICVDGAVMFNYCDRCHQTFKEILAPQIDNGFDKQHTVDVWELVTAPTTTDTGLLRGTCTAEHCNEICTYTLPAIDANGYDIVDNPPNYACGSKNTAVATFICDASYRFTVDGEPASKLEFTIVTSYYPHTYVINGEYFVPMDLSKVYDLSSGDFRVYNAADDTFYANNIDADGNQIMFCYTEDATGCFRCLNCGLDVEVRLQIPHTIEDWNVDIEATCTSDGESYGFCSYARADGSPCGARVTRTDAAHGHSFDYVLSFENDGNGYIYTLNADCSYADCEEAFVLTDEEIHDDVIITPYIANCESSGYTIHSLVIDGTTVTAEEEVAIIDHTILGYTIPNIDEVINVDLYPRLANATGVTCATDKLVTLPCDSCGERLLLLLHKDHTPVDPDGVVTLNPGCETYGTRTLTCQICVNVTYDVEIEPTGHTITSYTKAELISGNTYIVYGNCDVCGEEGNEELVLTYNAARSVTPTCTSVGHDVYTREDGREIIIPLAKAPHKLNGNIMDAEDDVYVFTAGCGLEIFADNPVNSCSVPVEVSYKCDVCRGFVLTNAVKPHTFVDDNDATNDTLPTCDSEGILVGQCKDCGPSVVLTKPIAKYTHILAYSYSLTQKILIVTCDRPDCEHRVVLTRTTRDVTPSTCIATGKAVYRGLNERGQSQTFTEILPKSSHTTDLLSIIDGAYPIYAGKSGTYSGTDLLCEQVVRGFYICTFCDSKVHCDVYQPHTPASDTKVVLVAPTCTEIGYYGFTCKFCEDESEDNLDGVFGEIKEVIPAKKHNMLASLITLPQADTFGVVEAHCTEPGCNYEKEYMIPTLNSGEYSITPVILPTCLECGVDNYRYTLNLGEDVRNPEYVVTFELESPVYEYVEGESTEFELVDEEAVTFVDPFGNTITEVVNVTYKFYRCDNDDCEVHRLIGKMFVFDENKYVFNFDTLEFELIVPDGEIEFTEEELNPQE